VQHQASEACTSKYARHEHSADAKRGIGSTQCNPEGRATSSIAQGRFRFRAGHHELELGRKQSTSAEHGKGRKALLGGHERRDQRGGSCKRTRGSLSGVLLEVRYGQVTLRIRALIGEDGCLLHAATRAIESRPVQKIHRYSPAYQDPDRRGRVSVARGSRAIGKFEFRATSLFGTMYWYWSRRTAKVNERRMEPSCALEVERRRRFFVSVCTAVLQTKTHRVPIL
jgi:hypothetical protein